MLKRAGTACDEPHHKAIRGTCWANDDICFEVQRGEVHALLGRKRGEAQSTLMNILYGLLQADRRRDRAERAAGGHL